MATPLNPKPGFKDIPLSHEPVHSTLLSGPKRWCCRCELDKPMKGGTTKASMFRCADCLQLAAEKAAAKKATLLPSSQETTP
jgi:hypothetical protein